MFKKVLLLALTFTFGLPMLNLASDSHELVVGNFSALSPGSQLPEKWKPFTFSKIKAKTRYELVKDGDTTVVKATSKASASGLIRKIDINPEQYPIIKWKWKVTNIYQNGDVMKKSGDDYPARIYIGFEYDSEKVGLFEKAKFGTIKLLYGEYPPIDAINYIWESKAPAGTMVPSPFTDRIRMVVVESGTKNLNTWKEEERNIYEDYIKSFGEKPPMISGVAIMTDSDNTGESAVSYYGDIVFESKN